MLHRCRTDDGGSSLTAHLEEPKTEMTAAEEIAALDREWVMTTYGRQQFVIERGEGCWLWDTDGRKYLDFLSGIAVVGVGHAHPKVAGAIATQAGKLMHISNLFHNEHQAKLAQRLCGLAGMDRVFFCNSGAEANEAALKIARKWGKAKRGADCFEIITFHGSFHGRTMGTVTATAQPKYQQPFEPLVPGFKYCALNDLHALDELISEKTCAVMIEPIQGESGVQPATPEFLSGVRALCDESEVLLILDEIQCGMGRTGSFLASQNIGVQGDIVTMAKGIADGFPMGACLARGEAATTLVPGDHGSTFAGQPLACAAAMATLDVMQEENLMENAAEVGAYFQSSLKALQIENPNWIAQVRGAGLMVGVQLAKPVAREVLKYLFEHGLIVNAVGDSILRLLPPLMVTREHCDQAVAAIAEALAAVG